MKGQRSAVSSSSRRENAQEEPRAKCVGCMSAIVQFVSKSQSSRKFLTFGKKQNKHESSFSVRAGLPEANSTLPEGEKGEVEPENGRKLSSEVPRSPTLPADIRQKTPAPKSPLEDFRSPPSLVARLMGLEEGPATAEMVAEKRQMLLGALQKCDEDLKALKKIIDAVRCKDQLRTPSPMISRTAGGKIRTAASPASLVCPTTFSQQYSTGKMQQQKHQLLKKPGEEEINDTYFCDRMARELVSKEEESVMWSSKAMIESVKEVCNDIAWGEKRELERIGVALQDHIYRDLIEEIVRELRPCNCFYTLPLEACKRRLYF